MQPTLIKEILQATTRVYDIVKTTDVNAMPILSESLDNHLVIKREDQQPVFSFKIRGAYNSLAQLSAEQAKNGVVTCSAGNHGQGLALSARHIGIKATVIMPKTTPELKIAAVKRFGAQVETHGTTFDEAQTYTDQYIQQTGAYLVHPFDSMSVIAGQGTIATELAGQVNGVLDYMFVPTGGGGLLAGVANYLKYLWPKVKIIAVEEENSACLYAALQKGTPVSLNNINIFADGIAVSKVGTQSFAAITNNGSPVVDHCVQVSVDEICAAMKDIYTDIRAIAEPAGAVAVAGIKQYVKQHNIRKKRIATILSGANVNFDRLNYITERSAIGEQREMIIATIIDESAGSFLRFCTLLGNRNITEFNYRYHDTERAVIYVGIKLVDEANQEVISLLTRNGYIANDLTHDEIAKVHVRHMVGGRAVASLQNERVYRFQFPEFPGALRQFLERIGTQFNISMFHYRNNSSAWGSVLAGIEVANERRAQFERYLRECEFVYTDETDSLVNRLFFCS